MTRRSNVLATIAAATIAAAAMALSASIGAQSPAPAAPAPASAPKPVCTDCGVVQSVSFVEEKGKTSGVGAVLGGVAGGVIGHQIGGGRGQTVATVAGAAGGAYVGNKVEQNRNTKGYWSVAIKMEGGQQRTFVYSSQPTVKQGDRVKLVDGGKRLALLAN
jgi:outer membrane lipoprotein SlyB